VGEVVRLHVPRDVLLGQLVRPAAPARGQRSGARETFPAVTVVGAVPREVVDGQVPHHGLVTDLGMHGAAEQLAFDHHTAADTGADGHLAERAHVLRRTPASTRRTGTESG